MCVWRQERPGWEKGLLFFVSSLPLPLPSPDLLSSCIKTSSLAPSRASPSAPRTQGCGALPGSGAEAAAAAAGPRPGAGERPQTKRPRAGGGLRAPAWGPARARSGGPLWPCLLLWALLGRGRRAGSRRRVRLELPAESRAGRCAPAGPGQTSSHPLLGARRRQPVAAQPRACGGPSARPPLRGG